MNSYSIGTVKNTKTEHTAYLKRFMVKRIPDHEAYSDSFYDQKVQLENFVFLAKKENEVAMKIIDHINVWNKIFKNKVLKNRALFREFQDIYSFKKDGNLQDDQRSYPRGPYLKIN